MREEVSEKEIGWLTGIIDGEGSLNIVRSIQGYLVPSISIYNTNPNIIKETLEILKKLEVSITSLQTKIYFNKAGSKRIYFIVMRKYSECKKLLNIIRNYVVGKREVVDVLLDFIDKRESLQHGEHKNNEILFNFKQRIEELTTGQSFKHEILVDYPQRPIRGEIE